MENYPLLVPLIILIPSIGAFINLFWGYRLGEKWVGSIATIASALAFLIAVILYIYLRESDYFAVIINPPLLDGWIRIPSGALEIPWQQRVDTLSVTMMLVITGIGTLIHVYSISYMHGDARYHRYFAYLNMFVAFMLILVTGNNYVMLFVGWEGVGLCSFLLIGFWFDKHGVGWKNSLAARKAFILNRVGDFGVLMSMFLLFYTFGTLDFYRPGEIANPHFIETYVLGDGGHGEEEAYSEGAATTDESHSETGAATSEDSHSEEGAAATSEDHSETAAVAEGEHSEEVAVAAVEGDHSETAAAGEGDHSTGAVAAEGENGEEEHSTSLYTNTNNDDIATQDLGVFGQTERFVKDNPEIDFGSFSLPFNTVLTIATLFMVLGVAGKSAQIPLFTWLPDAMAGPTPASALIHAATMVTAGVYLMVRSNVLFYYADLTSFVVTIVGASTAIVAGFIAIGQWDIKRVLAYSTVSQLGFMVAAVGVGAYGAAMFHLVTHAFFKALLFLGSGSVIHAMEHGHHHAHSHGDNAHTDDGHAHDEHNDHDADHHGDHEEAHHDDSFDPQDMRNMGGLGRRMPLTYITYLAGTLALAGIIPFAGFWSKDEILADSWVAGLINNDLGGYIAFGVLLLAAGLTAFYMWRQIKLVFHGEARTEAAANAPESAPLMTIPLLVLGFFSVFVGFMNTPADVLGLSNIFGEHAFTTWLEASVAKAHAGIFNPVIAILALGLAIAAMVVANNIYGRGANIVARTQRDPLDLIPSFAPIWRVANARLYWDAFYNRVIERPFNATAYFLSEVVDWRFYHDWVHNVVIFKGFNTVGNFLAHGVDTKVIDGAVLGVGRLTRWVSDGMRQVQTGYVRVYAISLLVGVVVVIIVLLLPLLQRGG
jgi:NADH-quinone oxidoreductase subunit L